MGRNGRGDILEKLVSELMRRGLNPNETDMKHATIYMNHLDSVMEADAAGSVFGAMGGDDGD